MGMRKVMGIRLDQWMRKVKEVTVPIEPRAWAGIAVETETR